MKLKTKKLIAREFILLICCVLLSSLLFVCVYPYNWIFQSKYDNLQETITSKSINEVNLVKIKNYLEYKENNPDKINNENKVQQNPNNFSDTLKKENKLSHDPGDFSEGIKNNIEYKKAHSEEFDFNKLDMSEDNKGIQQNPFDQTEGLINRANEMKAHPEEFDFGPQYESTDLTGSKEYLNMSPDGAIAKEKEKNNKKYNDYLSIKALLKNYNSEILDTIDIYKLSNKISEVSADINKIKEESFNNYNTILTSEEQLNFGYLSLQIFLIILYPLRFLLLGIKWAFKTLKQKEV